MRGSDSGQFRHLEELFNFQVFYNAIGWSLSGFAGSNPAPRIFFQKKLYLIKLEMLPPTKIGSANLIIMDTVKRINARGSGGL